MEHVAYLRQQANRYRELAEAAPPGTGASAELAELAATCERVAAEIEDRVPGG